MNATPRPLYPRQRDPLPILEEAEWALGPDRSVAATLTLLTSERAVPASSELLYRPSHPGLLRYRSETGISKTKARMATT